MTTTAALSMKLLIDRKAQRVLFAEASKEVVDFLFSLLALPVATAVKLVGKDAMVGCVGNLYASVDKLDATYVQAGAVKDALLCPTVVSPAATTNSSLLRLPAAVAAPSSGQAKSYYKCQYGCKYVTDMSGTGCPACHHPMQNAISFVASKYGQQVQNASTGEAKGFVQGIVTYTVLDDLTVCHDSWREAHEEESSEAQHQVFWAGLDEMKPKYSFPLHRVLAALSAVTKRKRDSVLRFQAGSSYLFRRRALLEELAGGASPSENL